MRRAPSGERRDVSRVMLYSTFLVLGYLCCHHAYSKMQVQPKYSKKLSFSVEEPQKISASGGGASGGACGELQIPELALSELKLPS